MKLILPLLASMFVMPAAFAAKCPASSKVSLSCVPTPAQDDSVFVAEVFDSIQVCTGKNQSYLLAGKGTQAEAMPATTIVRPGGTTYTVLAEGAEATFSVATGILATEGIPAKLTITMTAAKLAPASSAYTCEQK